MSAHVWVVEWFIGRTWQPCAEALLSREEARTQMEFHWRHNYPTGRFRIRKYTRDEGGRK